MDESANDPESIVGDECHIVSKKTGGPRSYKSVSNFPSDFDSYENLILLCKLHHKLVDDQPNQYDILKLRELKKEHEQWVSRILGNAVSRESQDDERYLIRVYSGQQLVETMSGCHATLYRYDLLESEEETFLVAGFINKITELIDFLDDMSPLDLAQTGLDLNQDIQELNEHGFWLFVDKDVQRFQMAGEVGIDLPCLLLNVARESNPTLLRLKVSGPSSENKV